MTQLIQAILPQHRSSMTSTPTYPSNIDYEKPPSWLASHLHAWPSSASPTPTGHLTNPIPVGTVWADPHLFTVVGTTSREASHKLDLATLIRAPAHQPKRRSMPGFAFSTSSTILGSILKDRCRCTPFLIQCSQLMREPTSAVSKSRRSTRWWVRHGVWLP